ncbi:MAG: thioredoxin family protein [Gammaproteobacteria bacterium]
MAATQSNMMPLGAVAPDFSLPDTVSGKTFSLQDLKGEKGTIVLFICNHCPYVLHVKEQLIEIARHYGKEGISTVAISANDVKNYPQDAPDKMRGMMEDWGRPFAAYLYDETQEVAKAYQAACTPDIYLFDADLACVYRGRLDGSTPKNDIPLTGEDLRNALENLLAGKPVRPEQFPSIGCNIKWKEQ